MKLLCLLYAYLNLIHLLDASVVVCYFNPRVLGIEKPNVSPLKPALEYCNYLIYGYAEINSTTYLVKSSEPDFDGVPASNWFKLITDLKKQFDKLKILVSVGGYQDFIQPEKYLHVLESQKTRLAFTESLVQLVTDYDFDGVDLGWQFPVTRELNNETNFPITLDLKLEDSNVKEHSHQFDELCKEVSAALKEKRKILTLSILPNVDYKAYYNKDSIIQYVKQVHLLTFDYVTPGISRNQSDHSATSRVPFPNINATLSWWLNGSISGEKLVLAIPTFGKSWQIKSLNGNKEILPVAFEGLGGSLGPHMKNNCTAAAYFQVCAMVERENLKPMSDFIENQGMYVYSQSQNTSDEGVWVSYESPGSAAIKAKYALKNGLGGIAITDLTTDDFAGLCPTPNGKYPILKAAKQAFKPSNFLEEGFIDIPDL